MNIAVWTFVGFALCVAAACFGLRHTIAHRNDMRAQGKVHQ